MRTMQDYMIEKTKINVRCTAIHTVEARSGVTFDVMLRGFYTSKNEKVHKL
jgi:hypothetical protein